MRRYKTFRSFDFYVILFFLISFFGWLWEGALYLVTRQTLVNRGVYMGPYLPIYGAGGVLLWLLLHRLYRKPVLTFLLSALFCSVLEYAVSYALEKMWGQRWWDYSGWFLNLNGRICLVSALAFGLGGMALNCFLLPYYMRIYHKLSRGWRIALSLLFLAAFVLDATYCAVRPHTGENISYGTFCEADFCSAIRHREVKIAFRDAQRRPVILARLAGDGGRPCVICMGMCGSAQRPE